jgi:diguanylate cyclase (GGDEF)-like protein
MLIRFWGTRGSIPSPGPGTVHFGGNTSCVELQSNDGNLFIFDCGTGIRELGRSLLSKPDPPARVHILIGHTHWDHIQGFPFFAPVFLPRTEINIYAPLGFQRSLEDAMSGQMQYSYFPVKLQELSGRIYYTELDEGFFRIGDCLVETQYLNHTAPTIGYRVTEGSTSIAYITDHEPFWQSDGAEFQHPGDQLHVDFVRDVDLLIHDAQYSEEEYKDKVGWGHSPMGYVADVAAAAAVKRLALFHHDPTHDDAWIKEQELKLSRKLGTLEPPIEVFAAAEHMELQIEGSGVRYAPARESALEHRTTAGQRVMLVSPDPSDLTLMERTLAEDGLVLMSASSISSALRRAAKFLPAIAIVDGRMMEDDSEFLESLRQMAGNGSLPVIVLTSGRKISQSTAWTDKFTDFLDGPFSPPMLRSRVRAWISRTVLGQSVPAATAPIPEEASAVAVGSPSAGTPHALTLQKLELFKDLEDGVLADLLADATEQEYPPRHTILKEGRPGSDVFVVISGRVRVVEAAPDGPADMFLGELGEGEIFGEIGVLRETPRSATVVTLERTQCLVLPREAFLKTLESSAALSVALLRIVAGRLADADRLLARYAPDPLTGLPGRRAFLDLYNKLASGARRRGSSVLLLLVDIADLGGINDTFGYAVGDSVLKVTARALLESLRATDLIARYGSDEFAALLTDADLKECDRITGRVSERLAALVTREYLPRSIHFNFGIAMSDQAPESLDALLRKADEELQKNRARENGSTPET